MKQVIIALLVLFLVGCAFTPPGETEDDGLTEQPRDMVAVRPGDIGQVNQDTGTESDDLSDDMPLSGTETDGELASGDENLEQEEDFETKEYGMELVELKMTGDTKLQTDIELCPHLARSFECDRYDLRACNFKKLMGQNEYYPDYAICRSGETIKGENPGSRYCYVQECAPKTEGNIVVSYGGIIAFAEYEYKEEKTPQGGVITRYTLKKCGQMKKDFKKEFDCQTYYSEWRKLWG